MDFAVAKLVDWSCPESAWPPHPCRMSCARPRLAGFTALTSPGPPQSHGLAELMRGGGGRFCDAYVQVSR